MKVNLKSRAETGLARRRRTLEKILRGVVRVLSQKTFDAATVDDFIAGAAVSRGTFYQYFEKKDDVAHALSLLLNFVAEDAMRRAVPADAKAVDRIAITQLTYLDFAARAPNMAQVMCREYLTRHPRHPLPIEDSHEKFLDRLAAGFREGDLVITSGAVMRDIVSGSLAFLMVRLVSAPEAQHLSIMRLGVFHMLLAMGISQETAAAAVERALTQLPLADLDAIDGAYEKLSDFLLSGDRTATDR